MQNLTTLAPTRLLKAISLLVLLFIPANMLLSPIVDFFIVANREASWTVTMSAYYLLLASMVFLAVALFFLQSRQEKIFLRSLMIFFLYAFAFTVYRASDLFYPIYGLMSVLGSALVGILFYVCIKDEIITSKLVFYALASASVLVIVPLLLVHIDIERFAWLAREVGATTILYGYENPRAVGWASTTTLALLTAYLSTQPTENKNHPAFLLFVVIAATTLFWSGSRGGIFAFIVSMSIVLLLSQTKNFKGLLSVLSCIGVGGVISSFLHIPSLWYGMFGRIAQNFEQESMDAVSSGRVALWQKTVYYISERPFTGYGFLPQKNIADFTRGSAHNIILDSWLWFGLIIGTIIVLCGIFFWVTACRFFRKADDPLVAALFCVVTTLLVYSMVSGPYARTFPLMLFAVSAGTLFGLRALQAK